MCRDWNNDGKHDMMDGYIEHLINKDINDKVNNKAKNNNSGSCPTGLIGYIVGLILVVLIFSGVDLSNGLTMFLLIFLWNVFGIVITLVLEYIGL